MTLQNKDSIKKDQSDSPTESLETSGGESKKTARNIRKKS